MAAQNSGSQSVIPRFEAAPCPFPADASVLEQVRCGYVTVLENRAKPDGRRLKLAVAILKSFSRTPHPDPVVRIAGGPGDQAVARTPSTVARPGDDLSELIHVLRGDRDVILYDQRGVGFSEPVFCPEEGANWAVPAGERAGSAPRRARRMDTASRCGDSMRRLGFDLSQYNSVANALDLQDMRRALGYAQWNVHGHSYGSRVALVALREAAEGIRSVVLTGVLPPATATWFNLPGWHVDVIRRVSAACAAQPACHAAYPEVEQSFWRTVEDLERNPWTVAIRRANGRLDTLALSGAMLVGRVHNALRTPRGLALVPMLVNAASKRDQVTLNAALRQSAPPQNLAGPGSTGLHFAVQCFEEAPLNTAELREHARRSYPSVLIDGGVFNNPSVCQGMHPFRAPAAHAAPVESSLPTLIVTGEFDPQTHRSNGPFVQRTLKNSQLIDVPAAGHSGMFAHECTRAIMRDFLKTPLQKRDTSCLQSIPRLQFVTDVKAIAR